MTETSGSNFTTFVIDVGQGELVRQGAYADATEEDPGEQERLVRLAETMLYSNLDPQQQGIYDQLVKVGVLPARRSGGE